MVANVAARGAMVRRLIVTAERRVPEARPLAVRAREDVHSEVPVRAVPVVIAVVSPAGAQVLAATIDATNVASHWCRCRS